VVEAESLVEIAVFTVEIVAQDHAAKAQIGFHVKESGHVAIADGAAADDTQLGLIAASVVVALPANTACNCSRNALRPARLVDRHAAKASSTNAVSATVGVVLICMTSSHPVCLPHNTSICRASLSPMGRDDLIWLHMLGEICKPAAKDCSKPLGAAPAASDFSA
jgi:hypothetical protein